MVDYPKLLLILGRIVVKLVAGRGNACRDPVLCGGNAGNIHLFRTGYLKK